MSSADPALQNHVGDDEFPVRPRRRYATQLDTQRRTDHAAQRRRALVVTAFAAPTGVIAFVIAMVLNPTGTEFANPFVVFVGGLFLGLLIAVVVMTVIDAGAPKRAQLEYAKRSGRSPLSIRQQQILALDASSDYSFRGWNSSLAFTPTFAELPAELRERYRDGQDGSPWKSLPVMSLQNYRAALDEQFKIASRTDAEVFAADAMQLGPLSRRFREIADGEDGERMISRVSALSEREVFDVLDLVRGVGDAPPRLLLAGDIERAIGGLRYAYVAGYLTADETWSLLEPVAARAFAAYSDWDDYWRDVLVATAFRTDSLDAVQQQRQNLSALRGSRWPAATVPYPTA